MSICADVFAPDDENKYELSAVIIPNTITSIGDNALRGNEALAVISVQDNALFYEIGTNVVFGCHRLDTINVLSSAEI